MRVYRLDVNGLDEAFIVNVLFAVGITVFRNGACDPQLLQTARGVIDMMRNRDNEVLERIQEKFQRLLVTSTEDLPMDPDLYRGLDGLAFLLGFGHPVTKED